MAAAVTAAATTTAAPKTAVENGNGCGNALRGRCNRQMQKLWQYALTAAAMTSNGGINSSCSQGGMVAAVAATATATVVANGNCGGKQRLRQKMATVDTVATAKKNGDSGGCGLHGTAATATASDTATAAATATAVAAENGVCSENGWQGRGETVAAATAMTNDNCGGNGLKGVLLLQVEGRSGGAVAREIWGSVRI